MKVEFYQGMIELKPGRSVRASWASSPLGIMALLPGGQQRLQAVEEPQIVSSDLVAAVDLPGLDRDGLEVLVLNILRRGYLDRPGVKDKGEAVLFMLVNEALTQLAGTADENDDLE